MTKENDGDVMITPSDLPWVPMFEGVDFKVLRTSPETGTWTVLFRAQAGASFPRHRHLAAGEYFMIKGRMEYSAGSAVAGDYGYESLDSIHDETRFPEYTELLFTNHGAVVFLDENDEVTGIADHNLYSDLAQQHALEAAE